VFQWVVELTRFLMHSPAMLPIPGTSSVEHLEENFAPAGAPRLTDRGISALDRGGESKRSVNICASVARFGPPAG
jgi:aryl-alcohol dehydrogenase-like predicted oxidoreductase